MQGVCLTHKIIDSTLFQYNMPLAGPGHAERTDTYVRMVTPARAAPGVTWREILAEFEAKKHDKTETMTTITWIEHRYLLSVSVLGFWKSLMTNEYNFELDAYISPKNITPEKLENLAKALVQTRDYEAAGGYFAEPKINQKDYWPKD